MATFFNDTFTETSDTPLENHTSDSGHTYLDNVNYEQEHTVYASGDYLAREFASTNVRNFPVTSCTPPSANYAAYIQYTPGGTAVSDKASLYPRGGATGSGSNGYFYSGYIYVCDIDPSANWLSIKRLNAGGLDGTIASVSSGWTADGTEDVILKVEVTTVGAAVNFNVWVNVDGGGYTQLVTNAQDTDTNRITGAGYPDFGMNSNNVQITRVWYETLGPTITDFGDEDHQWGESGLIITGTGFGT